MSQVQSHVQTEVVPAGWYQDSPDPTQVRWWNGTEWTDHVQVLPSDVANAPDVESTLTRRQLREQNGTMFTGEVDINSERDAAQLAQQAQVASVAAERAAAGAPAAAAERAAAERAAVENAEAVRLAAERFAAESAASERIAAANSFASLVADAPSTQASTTSATAATPATPAPAGSLFSPAIADSEIYVPPSFAPAIAESETYVPYRDMQNMQHPPSINNLNRTRVWDNAPTTITAKAVGTQTFPVWLFALLPVWSTAAAWQLPLIQGFPDARLPYLAVVLLTLLLSVGLAQSDRQRLSYRGFDRSAATVLGLVPPLFLVVRAIRLGSSGLAPLITFILLQVGVLAAIYLFAMPMVLSALAVFGL